MNGLVIRTVFLLFSLESLICESYTPIVIWHGIADTCCNNTNTGKLQSALLNYLPGSHVISLQIGNSKEEDYSNSLVLNPDKQVAIACNIIKSDPLLANGYNAIGFSQGSQLLRGVLQRCPEPRMKKLITMAGQHQGVYGIPTCDAASIPACDRLRQLVNRLVYFRLVQRVLVPATYWHNPLNKTQYQRKSTYLADINNERIINKTYIKNLQSLEKFVMVRHGSDEVVQPTESSWFGFYKDGQSNQVESLRESEIYLSDRLGLQQMDKDGKLDFLMNTWRHEDFVWPWFRDNIVNKYLK